MWEEGGRLGTRRGFYSVTQIIYFEEKRSRRKKGRTGREK